MPRDGRITKQKIMDAAQELVLDVGLGGTSVERVVEGAGVSRGTFFYHFKTKHDLAASLLERYAQQDREHFEEFMEKAEQLSRDPRQQLLLFVGLFIEMTDQLDAPFPGCLYASYCYQSGAVTEQILEDMKRMTRFWRRRLTEKVDEIRRRYPPCIPVESSQVADHVLTTFEGAFVISKILGEPEVASHQLIQCRNYLELLFAPGDSQGEKSATS